MVAANSVVAIDPHTNRVVGDIPVGLRPQEIASEGDAVWVANEADGTVSRIDSRSAAVVATIPVGHHPTGVAADGHRVWVTID